MKSSRTDNTDIKNSLCEALYLLSEDKPREKVTVSALIEKAGICRSSFYYYFDNVDSVFKYMVTNFCQQYQKAALRVLNEKASGVTPPPQKIQVLRKI